MVERPPFPFGATGAPARRRSPIQRHKNRTYWNETSDAYQAEHGARLAETPLAWGVWRVPEAEVRALGDVAGRDVLELGCGAAQWTAGLAASCRRSVGVDLSERQLASARRHLEATGAGAALAQADAEQLPFRTGVFDLVFCDHGAMSFARPERTVAEVARVLRPGGAFAFCTASPFLDVCRDASDRVTPALHASYFELDAIEEDGGSVTHQRPYGAWIRLFRLHGLAVEDLIELRPAPGATTTYRDFVDPGWARRWPAECLWRLSKSPEGPRPR